MAITRTTHFYQFMARLRDATLEEGGEAMILGMQLVQTERFTEEASVLTERVLPPVNVDFSALAEAMSDVNLAAAQAAFAAEITARA